MFCKKVLWKVLRKVAEDKIKEEG